MESLKRSNTLLKVIANTPPSSPAHACPHPPIFTQAEAQRNADMLQRARAELADERQRAQQVLLELATFEAEKTNMKQEISGKTNMK